ncbi:MAG: nucleotidyl transferase AbiEii/AbiGii toxin family protein [Sphaerochaeta sp.]
MRKFDKGELGRIARQYGFVRDTFEKVIRLTDILRFINRNDYLNEHLVLKGGTAINLAILNLPRLSVDMDLDYTPNDSRNTMLANRERITFALKEYMENEGYLLSSETRSRFSLDSFVFKYNNFGGNPDLIKIEINYSLRTHVLNPVTKKVLPEIFDNGEDIRILNPMEIFAAKANALMSRAAVRDLYDFGNLIKFELFKDSKDMFRKCIVFYATISAPLNEININFDTSAIDRISFHDIKRALFPVIRDTANFDLKGRQEEAKAYLSNLMILTESEKEYMRRFVSGEYKPELLFDNPLILENIGNHPMPEWKRLNMR